MNWIRELILGNWRNKGVALFFAVTIWYFAFQSEKTECLKRLTVEVESTETENVITRVFIAPAENAASDKKPKPFDNSVAVTFSGPRKQIERLRNKLETSVTKMVTLEISPDLETYQVRKEDFRRGSFLEPFLEGIEITGFEPPALIVKQEPETTQTIDNLRDHVTVASLSGDFRNIVDKVDPSEVTLIGPESFVANTSVTINVDMDFRTDYFEGLVPVKATLTTDQGPGVIGRVKVIPSEVYVRVLVQAVEAQLPVDDMRITFLIPPVKTPVKILMNDLVGDRIPVQFEGPADQIERLKQALTKPSDLCLGIRVRAPDLEQQQQFTFTEDELELCGSKDVYRLKNLQISQHPDRRKEKKAPWSYTVVPVKEEAK